MVPPYLETTSQKANWKQAAVPVQNVYIKMRFEVKLSQREIQLGMFVENISILFRLGKQ